VLLEAPRDRDRDPAPGAYPGHRAERPQQLPATEGRPYADGLRPDDSSGAPRRRGGGHPLGAAPGRARDLQHRWTPAGGAQPGAAHVGPRDPAAAAHYREAWY